MKKKILSSTESVAAMVLGLAALGCGGAIENAANGWIMLGWTAAALVLGGVAIVLLGLAVANCEEEKKNLSPLRSGCARGGAKSGSRAAGAKSGRKAG